MKLQNTKNNNNGFTLIELMVATSIFVVIMLGSMSSLFVLLDAGKNSRALRFAMDNVNFAMESMTRSIRMGTNYYCVDTSAGISMDSHLEDSMDCPTGETFVAFVPQQTTTSRVGYRLTSRNDERNTHSLQRCDINGCVDIVSPDVDIEKLKFFVNGSNNNDNTQASVYIIVKGSVLVKEVPVSFSIQTLASQRNF
ncbi:MAG TPA: type II secretion system protein [Candidatus Paceibacterota bacterium]|nr:type II secretion system protein [Candidatus Paceibacterota bacterium]